ncbi:hypothetical protein DJ028_13070 [Pseudomonas veronii]|nr:hypothetical protein DJ028_13070 [Pseudomonas veronii]
MPWPKPSRPSAASSTTDAHLVGASLLAKNPRTPQTTRFPALSLTIFASKLAPTASGHHRSAEKPPTRHLSTSL